MSNRSDISDITMSNRSELGEKSAQQPRTPLIKRKSGGASHLFCLDARTRRAWELVTLLFLGNVVQQSAAYLLIGLYSIDSSVGAHYSIRAATKLSPTVYGLMLGFIMDIPRAIANGLAGALAARAVAQGEESGGDRDAAAPWRRFIVIGGLTMVSLGVLAMACIPLHDVRPRARRRSPRARGRSPRAVARRARSRSPRAIPRSPRARSRARRLSLSARAGHHRLSVSVSRSTRDRA